MSIPRRASWTSLILPLARRVTAPFLVATVLVPLGAMWPVAVRLPPPGPPPAKFPRPCAVGRPPAMERDPVVVVPPRGLLVVGPLWPLAVDPAWPVVGPVCPVDAPCAGLLLAGFAATAGLAGALDLEACFCAEAWAVAPTNPQANSTVSATGRQSLCRNPNRFIRYSNLLFKQGRGSWIFGGYWTSETLPATNVTFMSG